MGFIQQFPSTVRPAVLISFVAAVIFHVLLLFGFRLGTSAKPLAISDEPSDMDVNLVAGPDNAEAKAPPDQPAATPEAAATPAPTPEPTPAPEPTPEPLPTPDTSAPEPTPALVPESTPEPPRPQPSPSSTPKPHVQAKPKPAAPSEAPSHATGQGNGHPGTQGKTGHGNSAGGATTGARPRYRSNPKPDYPIECRRNHQQGFVMVSVEVGANGQPNAVALKQTSGVPALDQAAIQAVRHWTFDPATAAGLPIASRVDVPVRFSLGQ